MKRTRFAALVAIGLLMAVSAPAALAGPGSGSPMKPSGTVDVQLLAINDFHGNLQPPSGSSGRISTPAGNVNAGGVEYLATHVKALEAQNPNTVVVSAGDLIGASPLLSALFHDEPTIEAMNLLGLDFNAIGNHEFDEGAAELLRMQNGGCHPVDGCLDGDDFAGADFRFLAANVVRNDNGKTLFPAYKIRTFAGARVAFIGIVLEGTPTIVTPTGVAGLTFLDEADTVNALMPELEAKGVNSIVVLIHEGGLQASPAPYNGCVGISGPIVDIVNRMDENVDVVLSGHTHQSYNCDINGKLVTSGASFGRLVTDVDLTIDRATNEITSASANNVIVTRDVAKDAGETALIAKYDAIAAPLANRVVGSITADITSVGNAAGESAAGDVIADAQLDATSDPSKGGAVVAFMNPGGIRSGGFFYAPSAGGEAPGQITYGELFTVQPFSNVLTVMSCTGSQIDTILEQQFNNPSPGQNRVLAVSRGFTYQWSSSAPIGSRVDIGSIRIGGVPISPTTSYRVTMNNFLATGGDNFSGFTACTQPLGGDVDIDALEAYFGANSPVAPGPQDRIVVVP